MKKLLLSLGTVAAIAAPVATVIACGDPVNSSDEIKTINSSKTKDELKAIDLKTLENKEVSHLEEAFGITTGINVETMVREGITYDGSKLVFQAGSLGEEVTYTFVISHDQYITDTALRENIDVEGQNGSGVMTFGTMVGVKSMHSDSMTGLSNGDRFPITIEYSDGYWGSPEITYEVVGLPGGVTGVSFDSEITKLNDALKDADIFAKVQAAIKAFNDVAIKAPADMAFADDIVEANQFANKQVKAQLFFQQDNAGSATFVAPDATDAPTNAETGVGMVDTTEVGHRINGVGKFGVRLVPSDANDPATAPISSAFSGYVTLANVVSAQEVEKTFSDETTKLNTSLASADIFAKVQAAIKAFNDAAVKAPADMAFADDIVEANQFANKQVKAQLFFQQDNAGSATFVAPDATDAPTNAETGVGMVDTTEVGHKINGVGKFGVRLVPSDQVDPATDAPTISAFKTFVTLANIITDLTKK